MSKIDTVHFEENNVGYAYALQIYPELIEEEAWLQEMHDQAITSRNIALFLTNTKLGDQGQSTNNLHYFQNLLAQANEQLAQTKVVIANIQETIKRVSSVTEINEDSILIQSLKQAQNNAASELKLNQYISHVIEELGHAPS